jgi:hypothetical protein
MTGNWPCQSSIDKFLKINILGGDSRILIIQGSDNVLEPMS